MLLFVSKPSGKTVSKITLFRCLPPKQSRINLSTLAGSHKYPTFKKMWCSTPMTLTNSILSQFSCSTTVNVCIVSPFYLAQDKGFEPLLTAS
ncbi:hypothetical protein GD564_02290 [Shigella flexneri]|nr:hypothetical protein [Shigella flexneri]EGD4443415.1 hypothetical protein [Escherichia coli]